MEKRTSSWTGLWGSERSVASRLAGFLAGILDDLSNRGELLPSIPTCVAVARFNDELIDFLVLAAAWTKVVSGCPLLAESDVVTVRAGVVVALRGLLSEFRRKFIESVFLKARGQGNESLLIESPSGLCSPPRDYYAILEIVSEGLPITGVYDPYPSKGMALAALLVTSV